MGREKFLREKQKSFYNAQRKKRKRAKSLIAGKGKDMRPEEIARPGATYETKGEP